jgi:hypothetical protein
MTEEKRKMLERYYGDGTIKNLVMIGFVTPTKLSYPVYVESVKRFMDEGMNKTEAVIETSIKCNVCESTVWKSIRVMIGN